MTEIAIVQEQADAGRIAADLIVAALSRRSDPTLGLATGSTPLPVWAALAERSLDLSAVRGFALDEYVGLPAGHPESYRAVVDRDIVGPLGLDPSLVRVPGDDGGPLAEGAVRDRRGGTKRARREYEAVERNEARIAAAGASTCRSWASAAPAHRDSTEPGSRSPRVQP